MRTLVAGGALILAVANPSGAQSLPAKLNHRLSPNDAIIVTTKSTGETRGVFVSASSASLVISMKGRSQEIPVADIAAIDRLGDPVWGGAIIGGAILRLGFMGGAGASCSPNCDSGCRRGRRRDRRGHRLSPPRPDSDLPGTTGDASLTAAG